MEVAVSRSDGSGGGARTGKSVAPSSRCMRRPQRSEGSNCFDERGSEREHKTWEGRSSIQQLLKMPC